MAKKFTKKIYYLRTQESNQFFDLENALKGILTLMPTVQDTQIEQFGQITQIMHRNLFPTNKDGESIGGLLIHIGQGTKDEHMPTMSNKPQKQDDDAGSQPPPEGSSFLRKQGFLYIFKHHVIFCGHGFFQPENVASYLNELSKRIKEQGHNTISFNVQFKAVANCDKLALIQANGVKSLCLHASAYEMSVNRLYQNSRLPIAKTFTSLAKSLFSNPSDEELDAQSDIHIDLELSLQGNSRATIKAQELIQKQAEEVINDETIDQSFTIITQNGETIKPTDVQLAKTAYIERYEQADSPIPSSAFSAVSEYFLELKKDNLLEQ